MSSKVTILNAFDTDDHFIDLLSREYDTTLADAGVISELLFVNPMHFSYTPMPAQYSFETLEPDLQRSVEKIKEAAILSIFTSWDPDKEANPAIAHFVNRLFHVENGTINQGIWGNTTIWNKRVRIITVIDNLKEWRNYKRTRDASPLPVTKVDFRLFGYGEVFTKTFGFLKRGGMNDYGRKCLETMQYLAGKDAEALGIV